MGVGRFFYIPRNKKFNFQPRYYDQRKEEMEKRVKKIKQELGYSDKDDPYVPGIRGQMRAGYFQKAQKIKRRSNMRMLIILVVLFIILYFLLFF